MSKRQVIAFSVWGVVTAAAVIWLALGYFFSEWGPFVLIVTGASLAYGPARAIALRRTARGDPVEPRIVPLRICMVVTGIITFGPLIAYAAGWDHIFLAFGAFLGGLILMSWSAAVFSDGYQALWLDALIFHGNLAPPEPDWVKYKR